jgi:DNA-binding beta-propeller fold protein YncE
MMPSNDDISLSNDNCSRHPIHDNPNLLLINDLGINPDLFIGSALQGLRNFGIAMERDLKRISIFDPNTLGLISQTFLGVDCIDVAVTRNGNRAAVTAFNDMAMVELDLNVSPPVIDAFQRVTTFLEDVDLTPDDRFALSVDGSASQQDLVSYDLVRHQLVDTLPVDAQAVAVSPRGDGLLLTARNFANKVHIFVITRDGHLIDSGLEVDPGGKGPINITFTPDGGFALVSNFSSSQIGILQLVNPGNIQLLGSVNTTSQPQSMVISRDGSRVYSLGTSTVDSFIFDASAGILTPVRSFVHSLPVRSYFGVDQIALGPQENRLFISSGTNRVLEAFSTTGFALGAVPGISANGGLAIFSRGLGLR